jgi:hypothetical protein
LKSKNRRRVSEDMTWIIKVQQFFLLSLLWFLDSFRKQHCFPSRQRLAFMHSESQMRCDWQISILLLLRKERSHYWKRKIPCTEGKSPVANEKWRKP